MALAQQEQVFWEKSHPRFYCIRPFLVTLKRLHLRLQNRKWGTQNGTIFHGFSILGPQKWDLEVTQKIVFDSPVVSHLSIFFASGLNDFPISVNLTSFFPLTSKYWREKGLDIFSKRVDKLNLNLLFYISWNLWRNLSCIPEIRIKLYRP